MKFPSSNSYGFPSRLFSSRHLALGAAIILTGIIGSYFLMASQAATPAATFEAEGGTITAPATQVTDATASGGKAIQFAAAATGGASACPPVPAYPDASCTGWQHTGTTLKKVPSQVTSAAQAGGTNVGWTWTGSYLNITQANAVISGIEVNGVVYNNNDGSVNNYFSGLKVENSYIRGTGSVDGWCLELGPAATVTDTEIGGGSNGTTTPGCIGILVGNYGKSVALSTITRVNIHHTEHGMRVDGDATIVDSYIHNFLMNDASNHTDGIMITAGNNITVTHSHISHGNTSTYFVQGQAGNVPIGTMTIEDTYFEGIVDPTGQVSSYGIDIENKNLNGKITLKNNVFTPANTWGNQGSTAAAILIPQAIGSSAMGPVCGNKYIGTSNLVRVEVYGSGSVASQAATCP